MYFCFFQVYAWGCGACLGCGSSEATALRPKLIEELAATRIVDISIGDSHCLALSHGKLICFKEIVLVIIFLKYIAFKFEFCFILFCFQIMKFMPGVITQWGSVAKEIPQVLLLNQRK